MRMLSQIIYIISRNWCSCNYSSGNYSICINNLIIWCGILIVDLRKVFAWFITSSIVGTNIYAMETIEHQGIRVNWTVFNVALSSPAGTSDIVMTSIPFPTSAFSCWNAIWLEPISDSESDSCHVMSIWQEWQESQQAASSGAVILPQTFHFSISHIGIEKKILLVSLVSMLITTLPEFYHGGNKSKITGCCLNSALLSHQAYQYLTSCKHGVPAKETVKHVRASLRNRKMCMRPQKLTYKMCRGKEYSLIFCDFDWFLHRVSV